MQTIEEGDLSFSFPDGTVAEKYDDWAFYQNRFQSAFGGTKAVDILHVDARQTWLIEVKDYRSHRRTKIVDIGDEIAVKVRDTLAGLVAAKCNATDEKERIAAHAALKRNRFRVVLHIEQPGKPSRLFPQVVDPSKLLLKLKQCLRSVDPHPRITDRKRLNTATDMKWTLEGKS